MRNNLRFIPIFFAVFLIQITLARSGALATESRVQINLGDSGWRFFKGDTYPDASKVLFDDSSWVTVGIPHCFNESDTYLNVKQGFNQPFMGTAWYRTRFKLDSSYRHRKIFIEFEGVNVAAAVYVNGRFIPGNSALKNQEATHVHGFIGFVVDVTDSVKFGSEENLLAVRVSNGVAPWFVSPGFGTRFMFSMGLGGIFRPVHLIITDPVYIPLNVYSVVQKWGTHVETIFADAQSARISMETNVQNDHASSREVELKTEIVDADKKIVFSMHDFETLPGHGAHVFSQIGTVVKPHLWYPAWSPYGKPYLYTVRSSVKVGGRIVDQFESPLGIRTVTWDDHFPLINGKKHLFWGFGQRYEYPALGSAVPEEQQWRDIRLMRAAGGRLVRPGHCASSPETVSACDAYGVMMAQPSGDDEYAFERATENMVTLKKELHRDLIIRDRNHPSVLMWEDDNGGSVAGLVTDLVKITEEWDGIHPRMNSPRDKHGQYVGDLIPGKTVLGQVNAGRSQPAVPTWNAESWIARDARHHWDTEKEYSEKFYQTWLDNQKIGKIFGYAQWYLVETQGEDCETVVGDPNQTESKKSAAPLQGRSLGCSAMDGNRIPKLIYRIWQKALWIPYAQQPGVALQSHWNLSGMVSVDAWSNCPQVELFVNGVSHGLRKPEAETGRCTWEKIIWEPGVIRVEGKDANLKTVCNDTRKTSGPPHHLVLSVEPPLVRPDGYRYKIRANGSDAAFVLATIVDEKGEWCPLADNAITFAVSGPGVYRGSYNFWATPDKPLNYHAPGDPELQAEGGMMKVAVRSTFVPGGVTVRASSPGLISGTATFQTVAVEQETSKILPAKHAKNAK